MIDSDIRAVLLTNFGQEFGNDPNTMIVEELGLCQGEARVDVAVINGTLQGFEIKSDRDTLRRRPGQMNIYNRSLDFVTLVVGSKHLSKSLEIIPKWWGVTCVQQRNKKLIMDAIRPHKANPAPDPEAIVQLIWRNEALEVLRRRNLHKGYLSKKKWILWERIIEKLPIEQLRREVRAILKSRQNWRSAESQG